MGNIKFSSEEMESIVDEIAEKVLTKMTGFRRIRPVDYNCTGESFDCNTEYKCEPPVSCSGKFNCPGTFSG